MSNYKLIYVQCKNCFGTGTVWSQKSNKPKICPVCKGECKVLCNSIQEI